MSPQPERMSIFTATEEHYRLTLFRSSLIPENQTEGQHTRQWTVVSTATGEGIGEGVHPLPAQGNTPRKHPPQRGSAR